MKEIIAFCLHKATSSRFKTEINSESASAKQFSWMLARNLWVIQKAIAALFIPSRLVLDQIWTG